MLIPKSVFHISKACDNSDGRYSFGSVRLEREAESNESVAVATDGCRLLSVRWSECNPDDFPESVGNAEHKPGFKALIPKKAWNEAAKLPPKKAIKPILHNILVEEPSANGTVRMAATDLVSVKEVKASAEGRFPKWRDVIPEYNPSNSVTVFLNAAILADTMLILAKMSSEDCARVKLEIPKDGEKAVKITLDEPGLMVKGAIMPLRKD